MPFHAFISYSHSADGRLAPSLQSKLERFATPWYGRRRFRLFRDETTLSATPALWPSIEEALGDSEYLILLASPEAAASRWVGREIDFWLTHKSADRLLIALTGGELLWSEAAGDFDLTVSNALPPNLSGAYQAEPLWVDLRWADDQSAEFSASDPRFTDAAADLAAALSGRPKDELVGAELRQRRRARQAIVAGVTAIGVTAVIAIAFAIFALIQRQDAITQRNAAVSSQLASQSETLLGDDLGLALLLAVESSRVGSGELQTGRGALIGALEYSPYLRLFLRPQRAVIRPVFAPDGSAIALVDVDGELRMADPATGDTLPLPEARLPRLSTAAFSDDGRQLALGADDGSVLVWDRDGAPLRRLGGTDTPVDGLAFVDGGSTLLSAGADGVSTWDVATGDRTAAPSSALVNEPALSEPNRRLGEETLRRRMIEMGGPGPGVAAVDAADAARGVLTWRGTLDAAPVVLGEHGAYINDIAIADDGSRLATAGSDGRVVIWSLDGGGEADGGAGTSGASGAAVEIDTRTPSADAVDFTPDGRLLIATSQGYPDSAGAIAVWDGSGRRIAVLEGHSTQVLSLSVSADGNSAASAAVDSAVIVWDLREAPSAVPATLDVSEVAFSPDGAMLMTGTDAGNVSFWSMPGTVRRADGGEAEGERSPRWAPIAAHGDCRPFIPCVSALAFAASANRAVAASGGSDGAVVLYDLAADPPAPRTLATLGGLIEGLAFSPDGHTLAAADSDGMVAAWDVASGAAVLGPFDSGHAASGLDEKFTVADSRLSSVVYTPDGTHLVTGGRDGTVRVWNAATGAPAGTIETTGESVLALAFTTDGRSLAAAGRGGMIDVFAAHAARGRGAPGAGESHAFVLDEPRQFPIGIGGAFTQVVSVAFSPDGSLLASTYDTEVLLWDVESGRRITRVLGGYRGLVFTVAFSPDGSRLLVAGNDPEPGLGAAFVDPSHSEQAGEQGSVTLRDIATEAMRGRACQITRRSLSESEWARYIGGTPERTCPAFAVAPERPVTAYTEAASAESDGTTP